MDCCGFRSVSKTATISSKTSKPPSPLFRVWITPARTLRGRLRLLGRIARRRYVVQQTLGFLRSGVAQTRRLRQHDPALAVGPDDRLFFLRRKAASRRYLYEARRHPVEQRHRRLITNEQPVAARIVHLALELPFPLIRRPIEGLHRKLQRPHVVF